MTNQQLKLVDEGLKEAVTDFKPNATYAKEPRRSANLVGSAIEMILASAEIGDDGMPIRCGRSVAVQGTHGTGKTSTAKHFAEQAGLGIVYLSAPVLDITSLYCSFPYKVNEGERAQVKTILHKLFNQDSPWLLIIDDFRRVTPSAQGAMFELMNEGSLSGQKLRGHVGTLLIDNPAGDGYQGVGGGDPAFETRFRTVEMDANDTPWRLALAAKYAEHDLKDLFDAWSSWDHMVRRTINPRVLDHLIGVTLEGLPTELGMPIMPSGRQKALDAAGNDQTQHVLQTVASCLGVPFRERVDNVVGLSLAAAMRNGWNVHIVGPHGVGKTAYIRSFLEEQEIDAAYLSMAHQTPADLLVTVPTGADGIEVIPNKQLVAEGDTPKAVVADEVFRAPGNIRGQMLELFQERSLGGVPLGVRSVIALNNPAKWGDFTYPVGKADEALCSRFEVNLFVTEEMIPWKDYLRSTYGDDLVKPFLEWRAHSIGDVERSICCPRVMEAMVDTHRYNVAAAPVDRVPLQSALPMGADGKRVPIRLHELLKRLEGAMVLGFSRIIAESDKVLAELRATGGDDAAESSRRTLEVEVIRALQNAELFELEEHVELCTELIMACNGSGRIAVFRAAKAAEDHTARQLFWARISKGVQESRAAAAADS